VSRDSGKERDRRKEAKKKSHGRGKNSKGGRNREKKTIRFFPVRRRFKTFLSREKLILTRQQKRAGEIQGKKKSKRKCGWRVYISERNCLGFGQKKKKKT